MNPVAKEGEPFQLTCSSEGGSPDPEIQWYRNGEPVKGEIEFGGTRDRATKNILTITPTINDDRSNYRCTVWNRAMREQERRLESYVSLNVHCKLMVNFMDLLFDHLSWIFLNSQSLPYFSICLLLIFAYHTYLSLYRCTQS